MASKDLDDTALALQVAIKRITELEQEIERLRQERAKFFKRLFDRYPANEQKKGMK